MRILFTGASSFTGSWFAKNLQKNGHQVFATLRSKKNDYKGVREVRIRQLQEIGVVFFENCSFGDIQFLEIIENNSFDVICHHGAQVENYKSLDFDVIKAVQDNTHNTRKVFELLKSSEVRSFVVTGSVFEEDEGLGTKPLRAFSPYGLSKGLSWQVFRYWGEQLGCPTHKFVIPNPFGPYEDPRFCAYLLKTWSHGEVARIGTPNYIRDNIHISLLAECYAEFIAKTIMQPGNHYCAPSGYIETQGAFTQRFAREIGSRLNLETKFEFAVQTDFPEPEMRVNTDRPKLTNFAWNEVLAWDELAEYYRTVYLVK